jgi:hypothetical protein
MPREHRYYVYMMANRSRTLYVGVTNSIYNRVLEHKIGKLEGFTKRYNINRLVWYEIRSARDYTRDGNQSLAPFEEACFDCVSQPKLARLG